MKMPSRRAGIALIVGIACGFAALLAVAALSSKLDKTDIAVFAALFTTVIAGAVPLVTQRKGARSCPRS